MTSLFEELDARLEADPKATRASVSRFDLTLLMFNARRDIDALFKAAQAELAVAESEGRETPELRDAVATLLPIFGKRERA